MQVVRKYGVNTSAELYELMGGQVTRKLVEAVGQDLDIAAFVQYYDSDPETGAVKLVCVIKTVEGELFGTASPTFNRDFDKMCSVYEQFGDVPKTIRVACGTSKAGRKFNICKAVK